MITEAQVLEIRQNLLAAEALIDQVGATLCNEPGNTPGGQAWNTCNKINSLIAEILHNEYNIFRVNTDPNHPDMRGY